MKSPFRITAADAIFTRRLIRGTELDYAILMISVNSLYFERDAKVSCLNSCTNILT